MCLTRLRGLRSGFKRSVVTKHGFCISVRRVGYPSEYLQRPKDQNTMRAMNLAWVMIALLHCLDVTIPLYVQLSCAPSQQLRPRIPRLVSPGLAPPSKLGVSSTPTFKQGGISCGKCKSVCSISRSKLVRCLVLYVHQNGSPYHARSFYFTILDSLDPFTGAGRHRIKSSRAKTQISPFAIMSRSGCETHPLRSQIIS